MKNFKCVILTFIFLVIAFKQEAIELKILEKKINVNGKKATVLSISQPDGTLGIRANKGDDFNVMLKNSMYVPTSIHWHGLILPNNQDGVAFITQLPIYPGLTYHYKFPLKQSGTYWMHSHYNLQEQRLLSAPLIIHDIEDEKIADKEAILFLTDFSFKSPSEIYQNLRCNKKMADKKTHSQDIVEVDYDAYLTNYRTLENPDVVEVKPGEKVRLRIINGSSSTNFFIGLDDLEGEAIAVDGNRIHSLRGSIFELAVAQRIDIVVTIPHDGKYFPIFAIGEGTDKQTGIILALKGDAPLGLPLKASEKTGPFSNQQELSLKALYPLAKKQVDKRVIIELGGNMADYTWTLNGQSWPEITPIVVDKGQRVELVFRNKTSMSHPMHLHGHIFQVTSIDGKEIDGAMRDTILVMPNSSVAVQFDADNPGVWPLHCHLLYHLEAGMLTVIRYNNFIQPL